MKKPMKVLATLGIATTLFTTMPGGNAYASGETGVVEVKADNLYLRSADDFNSKPIRVLHKGEAYITYAKSNGMYNLGGNQWVTASPTYVNFKSNDNQGSTNQGNTNQGNANQGLEYIEGVVTIKAENLFVRQKADFDSKALKTVHKGETYVVYAKQNGMYNVGGDQWVTASPTYVSFASGSATGGNNNTNNNTNNNNNSNNTVEQASGKIQVIVPNLYVRNAASFDATPVDVVTQGEILTVYGKQNGLYKIGENRWITASSTYVTTNINSGSSNNSNNGNSSQGGVANAEDIVAYGMKFMGMPYIWASSSPSNGGFDCSGFIYYVFKNNGYDIYRTNVEGYWNQVQRLSKPSVGDLVFFQNTYRVGPSHIGIYIGDGKFLNANSSKGIAIDNLSNSYWTSKFLGYGRLSK